MQAVAWRMGWTRRIPIALALAMLVVPIADAQTTPAENDRSGNGFHLTINGDPIEGVQGDATKTGTGFRFDTDDSLSRTDANLDTGSVEFSATIAFKEPSAPNRRVFSWHNQNDISQTFAIRTTPDNTIDVFYPTGELSTGVETVGTINPDYTSLRVAINDRTLLDTQVFVKAWDASGNVLFDETLTSSDEPSNENMDELVIGANTTGVTSCSCDVYELRAWDSNVDLDTLDAIADPTNPEHTLEPEGTEHFAYFLQETVDGEINDVQEVELQLIANNTYEHGESMGFTIYATNATGIPVSLENTPNITFSRFENNRVEFFNFTSNTWGSVLLADHHFLQTDTVTGDSYSFRTTFPASLLGEGAIHVTGFAAVTDGQAPPQTNNLTVQHNMEVTGMIEISGMDSSALIHLGITGIFFLVAAYEGWIFPAVAGIMGIFSPIFESNGIAYPIDLTAFVTLAVIAVVVQMAATRFVGQGRGGADPARVTR